MSRHKRYADTATTPAMPIRNIEMPLHHYRRGDLELAYKLMDNLSKNMPDDPFYHEFQGDILLSMAKPDDAAIGL